MRLVALLILAACTAAARADFINFETPQTHPVDMSPSGQWLAVCNTADARVELFQLGAGTPTRVESIPVGIDPVSVRFRNDNEFWVVNRISDTLSLVNVATRSVFRTLQTPDDPCDVIFAGSAGRAFVSCSLPDQVAVYDPAFLDTPPSVLNILGESPRALAVSPDKTKVYVAIFESGNRTTIVAGGADGSGTLAFPPNAVNESDTPHNGQNPPFNGPGNTYIPEENLANPIPRVSA